MKIENISPKDIERVSMEIIESQIGDTSNLTESEKLVVKRVIHATADFDYLSNIVFSKNAVELGKIAFKTGCDIVTDSQMAFSGISKPALSALGCNIYCFMSEPEVAKTAAEQKTTRASIAVDYAAKLLRSRNVVFVVGNAPTSLIRISELVTEGAISPSLVVGTPVGFVNVIQSKELIMRTNVPYIVAKGRKGGSTVAAAVCNALLYQVYNRETGRVI